jgi:putative ABC transport system substrate-binding protein
MAPQAQQTKRRIGFLNSGIEDAFTHCVAAFKQGLSQSSDSTDVEILYRWADGNYHRLRGLADELIKAGVEVIAASGGVTSAKEAQDATTANAAKNNASNIPIVFVCGFDPADPRVGLVTNLCNPGGNATGVNVFNTELLPRRRELLSQLVPKMQDCTPAESTYFPRP